MGAEQGGVGVLTDVGPEIQVLESGRWEEVEGVDQDGGASIEAATGCGTAEQARYDRKRAGQVAKWEEYLEQGDEGLFALAWTDELEMGV